MLNSRYVYLSEALGLGPLWLKRGVHWQTENNDADLAQTSPAEKMTATSSPPSQIKIKENQDIKIKKQQILSAEKQQQIEIYLRLIYAISQSVQGGILWLTLRSNLSIAAAQMTEKSTFNHLLANLQAACGDKQMAAWYSFPESKNWQTVIDALLQSHKNIYAVVMLGEGIDKDLHIGEWFIKQHNHIKILSLPHPAQFMRSGSLKKQIWEKLKKTVLSKHT